MKIITATPTAQGYDIRMKPDSTLLKDSKPFFVPTKLGEIVAQAAVVARISRLGKNIALRFASRYYDALTAGVVFTATGIADDLARSLDASAVTGNFVEMETFAATPNIVLSLRENGTEVVRGDFANLVARIDSLIVEVSSVATLKTGDLLFLCLPELQRAEIGRLIEGFLNNERRLRFYIR
jgi:hypothetical protein